MEDVANDTSSNVMALAGCVDNSLVPKVGALLTDELSAGARTLYGLASTCMVYLLVIYTIRVTRDVPPFADASLFRSHLAILSLPPVIAAVNLCAVFVPRSLVLAALVENAFFAFIIARFLSLLVRSLGGREKLVETFTGTAMQCGRAMPGCGICCVFCVPTPKLTEPRQILLGYCIYQYCFLQPVISFLAAVLNSNGNYTEGLVQKDNAYIYLKCIQVISMLLCFHCLTVVKMLAEKRLEGYRVGFKFFLLKATMILINLQALVFGLLGRFGVFKCAEHFSAATLSSYYLSFALVFEMTLLGSFAVFVAFPFRDRLDKVANAITQPDDKEINGKLSVTSEESVI